MSGSRSRHSFRHVDADTVELSVSTKGSWKDPYGRALPERLVVRVRHAEGFGALVSGTNDPVVGRRALRRVGYKGVKRLGYRPYIGEGQTRSPGGDIVFFFDVGGSL